MTGEKDAWSAGRDALRDMAEHREPS